MNECQRLKQNINTPIEQLKKKNKEELIDRIRWLQLKLTEIRHDMDKIRNITSRDASRARGRVFENE